MTHAIMRLAAISMLATLTGCTSNTPRLDSTFGQAARNTMRVQVLNTAPVSSQSVAGLDGQAAKSAYDNYQKSFREPVPQSGALSIGVGR